MNATIRSAIAALGLLLGSGLAGLADTELVMVEQDGCIYCARWHRDLGEIYPRTDYAAVAPLRVMDIDALPGGLTLSGRVVFTPTFLLVTDGVEQSRVEGYVGDELFWMNMDLLLRDRIAATEQGR